VLSFMKNQSIPFDCVIYVYKTEEELPLDGAEFEPCKLVRHAGYWMDHLRAYPSHVSKRPYVLHWLDSIQAEHVSVARMIHVLEKNKLAMVSPSYTGGVWEAMSRSAGPDLDSSGHGGRTLSFVEFQLNLFTRESFHCLQSKMLWDAQIHFGWGVDELFPSICHAKVGVIDDMSIVKWRPSHELYDPEGAQQEQHETYRQLGFIDHLPDRIDTTGFLDSFLQIMQRRRRAAVGVRTHARWSEASEDPRLLKSLLVPVSALVVGAILMRFGLRSCAFFFMFFGAQTSLTFYMKHILSESVVSKELGFKGLPAPFAVTGIQQLVSFVLLLITLQVLKPTSLRYQPTSLESLGQVRALLALALAFVLNIGLNNLSLSLVDISVNIAIRSTAPIMAMMIDASFASWFTERGAARQRKSLAEVLLVICGTCCAAAMVVSKAGHGIHDWSGFKFALGVGACIVSTFFASVELVVVKSFSTNMSFRLNPVDTILYVAVPNATLLAPLVFFVQHPVSWPGQGSMTDWEVLQVAMGMNPGVVVLALGSGALALGYNVLLYSFVQGFSPHMAALSSNFNKLAAVTMSEA